MHPGIRIFQDDFFKMCYIFFPVGCIDNQKIFIIFEPVQVGIIKGSAIFILDQGVLTLPNCKGLGIVCQHMLQKGDASLSF